MNTRIEPLINQNKDFPGLLLRYRLIWYKQIMSERLLRFKHLTLILAFLIAPTFAVLPNFIASPLLFIVLPNSATHPIWIMLAAVFVQAIYVFWVALQKEAIMGGQAMIYLSTLPLPLTVKRKIDLKLLLIANHLFWLPIFFSLTFILRQEETPLFSSVLHWAQLILGLLVVQWLYLHARFFLAFSMILLSSIILSLLPRLDLPMSNLVSLFNIIAALWISHQTKKNIVHWKSGFSSFLKTSPLRFRWKLLALIKVNYTILFRKYRQESYFRLFFCALMLMILYQISIRSSFDIEQTYPVAIAIPLLIASGWYNKLFFTHRQYHPYLASLPIPAKSWIFLDIGFVFLIILSFQTLFFIPFLITGQCLPFKFFQLILMQTPLMTVLYLCQTRLSKLCHVAGTLSTGLWLSWFLI